MKILKEGIDELRVAVPFHKPDISLPADIVEEILRIDGLDNIEIPSSIKISPSAETLSLKESLKEKIAERLAGIGFSEILTNSITNSKYFSEAELQGSVKMLNSLSAELDVLRPSMLETGLEIIAYNIHRQNSNILFFEFGKTYHKKDNGIYEEKEHLSLYISGNSDEQSWKMKARKYDIFSAKGISSFVLELCGLKKFFILPGKKTIF